MIIFLKHTLDSIQISSAYRCGFRFIFSDTRVRDHKSDSSKKVINLFLAQLNGSLLVDKKLKNDCREFNVENSHSS